MLTEQEQFWKGEFGDEYNRRSPGSLEANGELFLRALRQTSSLEGGFDIESIVELGAGVGTNLRALHALYPRAQLAAVEINKDACMELAGVPNLVDLSHLPIGQWKPERSWDLAFTKGVLIHIPPQELIPVYNKLFVSAARYILVAEYYNPKPVEVTYRGHAGRLWKRDFAGEMLDRYPELRLIDYGFVYHRDAFPQDDLTWFLMEKSNGQRAATT